MGESLAGWVPPGVDLERPNAARVYDYLLGGACNFAEDRRFAEELLATIPEARGAARLNRAFLRRAVRFCLDQGVRQFLDLGSGIPTAGNVHEIAQREDPQARVVYVDSEPVAVAHSELILQDNVHAGVARGDLLDVDGVLRAPAVRELIDFERPVAVLMAAVLHFVPDTAAAVASVARYVDLVVPGSFLVLSHAAKVSLQRSQDGWRLYDRSSTPGGGRTRDEITAFFDGTSLVSPGVVWTPQWRPESPEDVGERPELAMVYAGVGVKG